MKTISELLYDPEFRVDDILDRIEDGRDFIAFLEGMMELAKEEPEVLQRDTMVILDGLKHWTEWDLQRTGADGRPCLPDNEELDWAYVALYLYKAIFEN